MYSDFISFLLLHPAPWYVDMCLLNTHLTSLRNLWKFCLLSLTPPFVPWCNLFAVCPSWTTVFPLGLSNPAFSCFWPPPTFYGNSDRDHPLFDTASPCLLLLPRSPGFCGNSQNWVAINQGCRLSLCSRHLLRYHLFLQQSCGLGCTFIVKKETDESWVTPKSCQRFMLSPLQSHNFTFFFQLGAIY